MVNTKTPSSFLIKPGTLVAWSIVLAGLYLSSLYGYLLFHCIAELSAVVLACGIFAAGFNSRRTPERSFMLFLGSAYLSVGIVDLAHTLGYGGMGVFPGYDANLPTQLWVVARYLESISLLTATIFINRKLHHPLILTCYTAVVIALLIAVFKELFPVCFVAGIGFTPFKKTSEYLICGLLTMALVVMRRRGRSFNPNMLRLLTASLLFTLASELAFIFHVDGYGVSALVGHYLKIVSYYCVYQAFIEAGFKQPYELLLRKLRKNEQEFHRSIEFYKSILDTTPSGVWVTNKDDVISYANKSMGMITGMKTDRIIGTHVRNSFPGETICQFEPYYQMAKVSKTTVPYHEITVSTPSGETNYQSGTLTPRKTGGDYAGVIGIVQDVTASKSVTRNLKKSEKRLKEAETALIATEAKMQAYLNNSPQMIYMKDLDGRYLVFNRACETVFNLSQADVLGKTNQEIYSKEIADKFNINDKKVMTSRELQVVDEVIQQNDGPHLYRSTQFPVYDETGRLIAVSGVAVDISECREMEKSLQLSRKELRRLAARMAKIEESEKKVLSQVLHDQVGQNLTAISINLTILKNLLPSNAPGEIRERLADSQDLIEETIEVTRDIVVELRPGILDDYGLLAALRWFGALFARRTKIPVNIQGDESLPKVLPAAIEISLFRITQEALTNIAKHAKADNVSITLGKKDKKIVLSIMDDGIGFDPQSPSSGLGLVMMRERVLSTGGHWTIKSGLGIGTKIRIEI